MDKKNEYDIYTTEAVLLLMTIAYNFMSLVKQFIINERVRKRLLTVLYKLQTITVCIDEHSDKAIVKMVLQRKHRRKFSFFEFSIV